MFLMPGLIIVAHITNVKFEAPVKSLMIRYMINHQNDDGGYSSFSQGANLADSDGVLVSSKGGKISSNSCASSGDRTSLSSTSVC